MPTLNVPYYRQWGSQANARRNDCGPASVAMILDFFGKLNGHSIDELSMATPLSSRDAGLTPNQLVDLASKYNLACRVASAVSLDQIRAEINAGRPVIALIAYRDILGRLDQADNKPGADGHFFVIIGFDDNNFIVNDPDYWQPYSGASISVPASQLDKSLTDMGYGRQCVFVQPQEPPAPIYGTAEIVNGPVRVRLAPNGTIVKMMQTGEQIEAMGDQDGWTQVLLPVWIKSEYLKKAPTAL